MDAEIDSGTIFIVDDDPTSLAVGRSALEGEYLVLTFKSGVSLLKMLEKKTPDLILLDVDMPDMDGYETLRGIKGCPSAADVPVIFLTAKDDEDSEVFGLSLGAVDYVTKPFTAPRLIKRIGMHLAMETKRKSLLKRERELSDYNESLRSRMEAKERSLWEMQGTLIETMAELVECRDDVTGGHIDRTTRYLGILAREVIVRGMYPEVTEKWDIGLLLRSAQLHDVGKIAVSDVVLNKPGKLTPEEFEIIRNHTAFGGLTIDRIMRKASEQEFLRYAKIFATTHHEKWDGSGYPNGLKGEEIPLEGRLMAIADVYDALISDRPYKKAYTHEQAVEIIMEGRGTHFDPNLADLFLSVADEFDMVHSEFQSGERPIPRLVP